MSKIKNAIPLALEHKKTRRNLHLNFRKFLENKEILSLRLIISCVIKVQYQSVLGAENTFGRTKPARFVNRKLPVIENP